MWNKEVKEVKRINEKYIMYELGSKKIVLCIYLANVVCKYPICNIIC